MEICHLRSLSPQKSVISTICHLGQSVISTICHLDRSLTFPKGRASVVERPAVFQQESFTAIAENTRARDESRAAKCGFESSTYTPQGVSISANSRQPLTASAWRCLPIRQRAPVAARESTATKEPESGAEPAVR